MDIREEIAQGESRTQEFKSSLQWDVRAGKQNKALRHAVFKTIAAFLNTDGGTLFIGVQDDGSIFGLEKDLELVGGSRDKFEQTFANLLGRYLGPQYEDFLDYGFAQLKGKPIYVVRVKPSSKPVYLQGEKGREFFIRVGTTTRALDPKETHEYITQHWKSSPASSSTAPVQEAAMPAFHTIAPPHDDILQGRLTLDVFAANLGDVAQGKGPEEYRDAERFFQKTYLTKGLQNLFEVVAKRLQGEGGDPVIQMQTPFGGGKTHALIALYHKAKAWNATPVVISGEDISGEETFWGLIAEQLTGSRDGFEKPIAPGRAKIQDLLASHQPVLILMDEVLEYMTKAAGVPVGKVTLADQTLAFMQELTEAASSLDRTVLVVTLPSSTLEHYGEEATRMFEQLKKVSGRVQKIFTPVEDNEIGAVIRRRLFSHVEEKAAAQMVNAFVEQAERESLLPQGEESTSYRDRFKQTYPFLPEVIDVLYHRWGSFPSFQRTRGTLRLLALVVKALAQTNKSYITLADFDLGNSEIRRELLEHIDTQFDSVLAADVAGPQAGAHKVNLEIGKSYRGLRLGERVATTIFMYSHVGGGGEAGATLAEIKRQNLISGVPPSVVAEVVQKLSSRLLFYLHEHNGRYYFTTTANLNRALTIRMENVTAEDLRAAEYDLLRKVAGGKRMATYLWPEESGDIPDNETPKLLILPAADFERMTIFMTWKGQTPRVNRNTLFFLTPLPRERASFENLLRRHLAYQGLLAQETLSLSAEQQRRLKDDAKRIAKDLDEQIVNLYRQLYLPNREAWEPPLDLGTPTYGSGEKLDERVYETLRAEGRLLEKLAPLVIKEHFLANRDYVETLQLVQNGPRTPGEVLVTSRSVWESAIAEGVEKGLFGLGALSKEGQPQCLYFRQTATVSLAEREILLNAELCRQPEDEDDFDGVPVDSSHHPIGEGKNDYTTPERSFFSSPDTVGMQGPTRDELTLRFRLPFGQASSLLGLFNLLQERFHDIEITIRAVNGEISEMDIENKVRETFRQIGTEVDVE